MAVVINGTTGINTGTGSLIAADSTTATYMDMFEDTDNGSNYVRLIAPSSISSNKTLTLPDVTGTILTSSSEGSVLQVVQGTTTTEVTISTATPTYTDTTLAATITPKFSNSKVLVFVNHGTISKSSGNLNNRVFLRLLRGSTQIALFGNGLNYTATAIQLRSSVSFAYLDSPATTASTEYKTQFANGDAFADVQVQTNGSISSIILMEIAG